MCLVVDYVSLPERRDVEAPREGCRLLFNEEHGFVSHDFLEAADDKL